MRHEKNRGNVELGPIIESSPSIESIDSGKHKDPLKKKKNRNTWKKFVREEEDIIGKGKSSDSSHLSPNLPMANP